MDNKTMNEQEAIAIELDDNTWKQFLSGVASWLNNVLLTQSSYIQLLKDTTEKVEEPHVKEYLNTLLSKAREHEEKIGELFSITGHKPSVLPEVAGKALGKMRQVLGDAIALTGTAQGPWQDIQQLYLSNANSMGAFAVVEQLGLALGIPELTETAFHIVKEKSTDQLVIQEFLLEYCSYSILYKQKI